MAKPRFLPSRILFILLALPGAAACQGRATPSTSSSALQGTGSGVAPAAGGAPATSAGFWGAQPQVALATGSAPVVSGASYIAALAPASYATFVGATGLSATTTAKMPYPNQLAGVQVEIGPAYAELVSVGPGWIDFVVPSLPPGSPVITIAAGGQTLYSGNLPLAQVAPALFTADSTGFGTAAAEAWVTGSYYDLIYSRSSQPGVLPVVARPVPLKANSAANVLSLYGTGWRGATKGSVQVSFDGTLVTPVYVGGTTQYDGLDQINVPIPANLASADTRVVDVQVVIGESTSNWARVCLSGSGVSPSQTCPLPAPGKLVAIGGTGQVTGGNGCPFGEPLTLQVLDANGSPIPNYPIAWAEQTGNESVQPHDPLVRADINGVASVNILGEDSENPSTPLDDGPGIMAGMTATVDAQGNPLSDVPPGAPLLSQTFFATSSGPCLAAYVQGYISQPTNVEIDIAANTTLKGAIQGYAADTGGGGAGKTYPNAGMRLIVQPNPEGTPTPTAICANGVDEEGTVLSDASGTASCDLQVGAVKGTAQLTVKMYGANEHTLTLVVQ